MFEALSSLENVEVFRRKEDALDWLKSDELPDEKHVTPMCYENR